MFFCGEKGFSLIEMMIAVLIVGIMTAVAIPNIRKYRESSQRTACMMNMRSIQQAIEEARLERDQAVLEQIQNDGKINILVTGSSSKNYKNKFLPEMCYCPIDKSAYKIEYNDDEDTYTVKCTSGKNDHDLSRDRF